MPESYEGYTLLPEDLLNDLLRESNGVVNRVEEMLAPALEQRAELRQVMNDLGLIKRYKQVPPESICGIDGGFAVERTVAVDMLLSAAVGVEGLNGETTVWDTIQYLWWTRVDHHNIENERLCRGVMGAQELAILAEAPHGIRILDGSHVTLVIQLNSAMNAESPEVRREIRRVWEQMNTVDALTEVCNNESIIAMPKYDSSRGIIEKLEKEVGSEIIGDDKHLLTLVLEPGEYTNPCRVPEKWSNLHFSAGSDLAEDRKIEEEFTKAIAPLNDRQIHYTYFKPDERSPAFRIEFKSQVVNSRTKDLYLDKLCSTITNQIAGPFIREPYPQYLADVMAKSVGLGLNALQAAIQLALGRSERPELSEFLIHSYRTEEV